MTGLVVCVPVVGPWLLCLPNKTTERRRWRGGCETNVTGISCEFCRDLHLALLCSGFLQKYLSKARWSYWHACHKRFPVFSPPPSFCTISLIRWLISVFKGSRTWALRLENSERKNCLLSPQEPPVWFVWTVLVTENQTILLNITWMEVFKVSLITIIQQEASILEVSFILWASPSSVRRGLFLSSGGWREE